MRQGQREAIGNWLVQHYGHQSCPPQTIQSGKDVIMVFNTLFGAMVVSAPRKLQSPDILSRGPRLIRLRGAGKNWAKFSILGTIMPANPGQQHAAVRAWDHHSPHLLATKIGSSAGPAMPRRSSQAESPALSDQ